MSKFNLNRKNLILFLLFVAMLHILSTYLVATRLGKIAGIQAAEPISNAVLDERVLQKEVLLPHQHTHKSNMYRNILFFLSLPFDPIIQPIHKKWAIRPFVEGNIRVGEYKFRANLIGTTTMVLNSIAFSLLVYAGLIALSRIKNND